MPSIGSAGLRITAIAFFAIGCGSGSKGGAGSTGNTGDFVTYWADGSDYCRFLATCGQSEADCLSTWATREEVEASIMGITADNIAHCETTSRVLDDCILHETCAEYAAQMKCMVQETAFETDCALVLAGQRAYEMNHPKTPYTGSFSGTYTGSEAGSFMGSIVPSGGVTLTAVSPSAAYQVGYGVVASSGEFTVSTNGMASGNSVSFTFNGTLVTSAPPAFTGTGTWTSSTALKGDWTLKSD